jgi:hypothetical protein
VLGGQGRVDVEVESNCFCDGKVIQVYLLPNKSDRAKYNLSLRQFLVVRLK